ncbi:MAG: hypothetical protein ABL921_11110 [Pirellula sp.]
MSEVLVFNKQIELMLDAGMPIVVGNATSPATIRQLLKVVSGRIHPESSPQDSTQRHTATAELNHAHSAIINDPEIDGCYRRALAKWIESGGSPEVFECFYDLGVAQRQVKWTFSHALLPSILLCAVLFPACYFMLFRIYPDIEQLYTVSGISSSERMRQLLEIRGMVTGPVVACLGLLLVTALLFIFRVPSFLVSFLPAYRRNASAILSIQNRDGIEGSIARPFTTYALRNRLQFEENKWVRWFPLVVSSLISGFVVIFYALLLFWPLTELLHRLSVHSGVKL